jgi:hypothetical protein
VPVCVAVAKNLAKWRRRDHRHGMSIKVVYRFSLSDQDYVEQLLDLRYRALDSVSTSLMK